MSPAPSQSQSNAAKSLFGFRFVMPLALGSTLNPINSTMIATAMVPIAADLHASAAQTGWLIAALYLTSAIAQPTLGRLADLFGPRRVYLASLCLVALAGLIGQWAPTLGALVFVRVLIGIGTSGAYPSAMRLFRTQAYRLGAPPPRTAMGVLSLAGISTAAIGPVLGGTLTGLFGWHAIFLVNVPLAILTGTLVLMWVPKDAPRQASLSQMLAAIDLPGVLLFGAALLCAMFFLMDLRQPAWLSLPLSAAFGVALVLHSLRRRNPFIDVRMLVRNRALTRSYLRVGLALLIPYCIVYGFAQWLESGADYTPTQAGFMTMPMSIAAGLASVVGARTKGIRMPFIVGIGSALAGCLCLLCIDSSTHPVLIAAALLFFGIPQGLVAVATQAAIYVQAPAEEIGTAAGLQRTATYIGAIASASLLGLMYGQQATDQGLHGLVAVMGVLSAGLLVATIYDRTLPRGALR